MTPARGSMFPSLSLSPENSTSHKTSSSSQPEESDVGVWQQGVD